MKFIFLLLVLSALHQECNKGKKNSGAEKHQKEDIPLCVQQKIDSIGRQPVWNPPAEVNEYEYEGKKVYLFSSPCCDQYNQLYDGGCNYLCAPSGGYTGSGDRQCITFFEKARHLRIVWKDSR